MKEANRFYSSLGLLIILNVIIKPLWIFGIDRQVQNLVGTAVYGNFFSLFNFSIVFSCFLFVYLAHLNNNRFGFPISGTAF